ncbi:6-phospho-3-hexuloisomerase [Methanobacterium subterraneum]|uniref:6-phospho-3-hexuloisomerase n=1 Tax=Methanobacterium subterraneum TaxID=59277 RepID=A0A7K4DPW0_9EURY|nr:MULTISPECIES: 6-phospho-3-hexuloisomerase [Methanobacterium]MBW4256491.1 6-phospho-3-hexuloisomerase [Methanobacterium sp. YSL]NMO10472.1 6-phospho-3-hexuloisomerase [Methanobacterium subterraneum]PKL72984.1 MAG: 6-phospho-3-hexuloisomerase [Methanobacteriales archaeon HGW-Methanobacteriales-2]
MILNDAIEEIVDNVRSVSAELDPKNIKDMTSLLQTSQHVFVMGLGRSGLVARAFAMRLMHLGISVYVVGETTTPALTSDDCLLAISGSGETFSIISAANIAHKRGTKIIAVTSYVDSTLGEMADLVVHIKGRTKIDSEKNYITRQMNGKHQSLSPMGTLFEVTSLIFLDGLIAQLMVEMGKTEEDMKARHTVIE